MSGFTPALKAEIRERDGYQCQHCGRGVNPGEVHHRRPRGMGGSKNPNANAPSRLVLLCGDSHRWIEANREEARSQGFLLGPGDDAEEIPILAFDGVRYVLRDDLTRTPAGWIAPVGPGG